MSHVRDYFEEMAVNKELEFIDEHKFVELVYADLPPVFRREKKSPLVKRVHMFWLIIVKSLIIRFRGEK